MDGTKLDMDRLYELYTIHFVQLRADISVVNRSLGSLHPEKTWMQMLERTEFDALVSAPSEEPDIINRLIRRIVRGHEEEFPELRVA
jgi:hypothetical protein